FVLRCEVSALRDKSTSISDTNFVQSLMDSDGIVNEQVLTVDIEALEMLNVQAQDIEDFTGLEDFEALKVFICGGNMVQGTLDLTSNVLLEELYASFSEVQDVDLTNCTSLRILEIHDNELTNLDVSNNLVLEEVYLGNEAEDIPPYNEFVTLDFSANPRLRILDSYFVFTLTDVNLDGTTDLQVAEFEACGLTSIDVSTNFMLERLRLGLIDMNFTGVSNDLTSVDVSNNPNLISLGVENTDISSLDLRNGANDILIGMNALQTPNLSCILVDDETAATNGDVPYGSWPLDAGTQFSETECTIGVEDYLLDTVNVFPNPVVDVLTIQNSEQLVLDTITVYDILGKKMMTLTDTLSGSLDMTLLPSGVYFVRMELGDAVLTKKVLKK
ncbi:MAG: Leucine-rich repeat (LRR) protein, partial [Flavobacteriales bacterium]